MKIAEQAAQDEELAAMEAELMTMTDSEIEQKTKLIQSESKVCLCAGFRAQPYQMLGRELDRLKHEIENKKEQIKANTVREDRCQP